MVHLIFLILYVVTTLETKDSLILQDLGPEVQKGIQVLLIIYSIFLLFLVVLSAMVGTGIRGY